MAGAWTGERNDRRHWGAASPATVQSQVAVNWTHLLHALVRSLQLGLNGHKLQKQNKKTKQNIIRGKATQCGQKSSEQVPRATRVASFVAVKKNARTAVCAAPAGVVPLRLACTAVA